MPVWFRGPIWVIMPNVPMGQTVADISPRLIFPDAVCRHLGFLKFYIFNDQNVQQGQTASLCQILSKSLNPWRRYVSFWFFMMAAAAMLDFWNYKILTVGKVQKVGLCHFQRNRSYLGRDMAIYRFFIHLGFLKFQIFNSLKQSRASNCVNVPNFVEIAWNAAEDGDFFKMAAAVILDSGNF